MTFCLRVARMVMILGLLPQMVWAQVLLKDASIYDASGQLTKTSILTDADGTIRVVDPVILAPVGVQVLDCTDKIVTPGFIDVGTSIGLVEVWSVPGTRDEAAMDADQIRAAFRAADGVNPSAINLAVARSGGITSVLSVPGSALVSGQSAWLDLWNESTYATVMRASVAMHIGLGERGNQNKSGSRAQAMLTLRELYDDVIFFQKNARAFDENRSRRLASSRLDLLALQSTLKAGMPVVFDVHRASDIEAVLKFAEEHTLRPIIRGGAEAWMVADILAKAKVPVILNPLQNLPSRFDMLGSREDNAALLAKAGVSVIFSTFDVHRTKTLRQAAGNAVRGGMKHNDAIRAITAAPAEAFGMTNHGVIARGKMANLVVWSGDPLELASQAEAIIVHGRVVPERSRQTELLKKYRTLQRRGVPAPSPESFPQTTKPSHRGEGPPAMDPPMVE